MHQVLDVEFQVDFEITMEANMGGQGSGRRPNFQRFTVDDVHSIDINHLNGSGSLNRGRESFVTWSSNSRVTGKVRLSAGHDRLHLSRRANGNDRDCEDVEQVVHITHVACHLGGTRPFFICPGVVNGVACGRRVAKLYGAGRYFLCRHCYRLPYACQYEQPWDRKARRAGKIRDRLGGETGLYRPFPDKPRGMWRRTYDRLSDKALAAANAAEEALLARY